MLNSQHGLAKTFYLNNQQNPPNTKRDSPGRLFRAKPVESGTSWQDNVYGYQADDTMPQSEGYLCQSGLRISEKNGVVYY